MTLLNKSSLIVYVTQDMSCMIQNIDALHVSLGIMQPKGVTCASHVLKTRFQKARRHLAHRVLLMKDPPWHQSHRHTATVNQVLVPVMVSVAPCAHKAFTHQAASRKLINIQRAFSARPRKHLLTIAMQLTTVCVYQDMRTRGLIHRHHALHVSTGNILLVASTRHVNFVGLVRSLSPHPLQHPSKIANVMRCWVCKNQCNRRHQSNSYIATRCRSCNDSRWIRPE